MTTQSFTQFVRTIEGQNQVELGHALGRQSSEGNISRILPLKDPIVILNKNNAGNYNPNLKNKGYETLVDGKCLEELIEEEVEQKLNCLLTFRRQLGKLRTSPTRFQFFK
uniref:Uncharacterized protein n=1 Tax=Angiostrongylus cantonensis TaxID=6313 RepID=A0A0K0DIS5_ANGCA